MNTFLIRMMVLLLAFPAFGTEDIDQLYKNGISVYKSDPVAAFGSFEKAANEEHVGAMVGLAACYEKGHGTAIEYAKALEWYEKGARQNSLKACEGLARIYASCPDPQFHDGDQAVRFATVVVKKKSRSFAGMELLAAARARALDFNGALVAIRKGAMLVDTQSEGALIKRRGTRYVLGAPYPEIASNEWIARAAEAESTWALKQLIWRSLITGDPFLVRARAMVLCERAIERGEQDYFIELGNLCLADGDVDAARIFFEKAEDWWRSQKREVRLKYMCPEIQFTSRVRLDANKLMVSARKLRMPSSSPASVYVIGNDGEKYKSTAGGNYSGASGTGGSKSYTCSRCAVNPSDHCRQCYSGAKTIPGMSSPGNPAGADFLIRVAALKGNREALEIVEGWDRRYHDSMELYHNQNGLPRGEWARALFLDAIMYGKGSEVPRSWAVMDGLCAKAYQAWPSARMEYLIGSLMIRETYSKRTLSAARLSSRGIDWLEMARAQGYLPAIRRLILLYACHSNEELLNGDVALEYAIEWVKIRPSNDHDAQRLLACAYARNGNYLLARQAMQSAINLLNPKKAKILQHYESILRCFEEGKPWTEISSEPSEMERMEKRAAERLNSALDDSGSSVEAMYESFKNKGVPEVKKKQPSFITE